MMKNRFKVFFQVFYSYMTILLIPLAFIAAIYGAASYAIEQNSRKQAEITLSTVANTVEMRIRELEAICTYLESSPELGALLDGGEISYRSGERVCDVFRLVNSLPDFSQANTMVSSVKIILKNGKYVLTPGSAVPYTPFYFSVGFPQAGQDFESFDQIILEQVHAGEFVIIPHGGGGY